MAGWKRPDHNLNERRRAIVELGSWGKSEPDVLRASRLSGAERLLWEAAERGVRHHRNLIVLVLRLSRLAAPAPRPHHIRVARVLLQDTAARHGGQVFSMRNQDLVLLVQAGPMQEVREAEESTSLVVHSPEVLPDTLARLFSADVPPDGQLTSSYRLDHASAALLDYLVACSAVPVSAPADQQHDPVLSLTALQPILAHAPLAELLVLSTGMRLLPDRSLSLVERLVPAFRCLRLSYSALNLPRLVSQSTSDPFLFRHLRAGLDHRLINLLSDDIARGGGLTRQAISIEMPLHIELGMPAVFSPDFARLARQAVDSGLHICVSMHLSELCADLDRVEDARRIVAATGGELIISLSPDEAKLVRPAALYPDRVKLVWSTSLLRDGEAVTLDQPLRFDPACIVLQGADTQRAVAWGQARGIVHYEGAFLDMVQAATRMGMCDHAGCCTLGQCCDRARATGQWGRTGCHRPALLDACGILSHAREHAA